MNTTIDTSGENIHPNGNRSKPTPEPTFFQASHGRNPIEVQCPYCGDCQQTTLWSLSGSGKRCIGCFAHINRLVTFRPTAKDLSRLRKTDPRRALWQDSN